MKRLCPRCPVLVVIAAATLGVGSASQRPQPLELAGTLVQCTATAQRAKMVVAFTGSADLGDRAFDLGREVATPSRALPSRRGRPVVDCPPAGTVVRVQAFGTHEQFDVVGVERVAGTPSEAPRAISDLVAGHELLFLAEVFDLRTDDPRDHGRLFVASRLAAAYNAARRLSLEVCLYGDLRRHLGYLATEHSARATLDTWTLGHGERDVSALLAVFSEHADAEALICGSPFVPKTSLGTFVGWWGLWPTAITVRTGGRWRPVFVSGQSAR